MIFAEGDAVFVVFGLGNVDDRFAGPGRIRRNAKVVTKRRRQIDEVDRRLTDPTRRDVGAAQDERNVC